MEYDRDMDRKPRIVYEDELSESKCLGQSPHKMSWNELDIGPQMHAFCGAGCAFPSND